MERKTKVLSLEDYIKHNEEFLELREEICIILPGEEKGRVLNLDKFVGKAKQENK